MVDIHNDDTANKNKRDLKLKSPPVFPLTETNINNAQFHSLTQSNDVE